MLETSLPDESNRPIFQLFSSFYCIRLYTSGLLIFHRTAIGLMHNMSGSHLDDLRISNLLIGEYERGPI